METFNFIPAIVLLLLCAHIFGYFSAKLKIPRVIGEIFGGLFLGPTVCGLFFPGIYNWVFNNLGSEAKLLSIIYWIGLVLLMFIAGSEIQKKFTGNDRKIIYILLLRSAVILILASLSSFILWDLPSLSGPSGSKSAAAMAIGIFAAYISIPVISRIFMDLNIINTRFAGIMLAVAIVTDIVLWFALCISAGTSSSASTSEILNIIMIIFALLAGMLAGRIKKKKFADLKAAVNKIAFAFFIPLYFAGVGFKVDLLHNFDILFFAGFLLFDLFFGIVGTLIAARIAEFRWLPALNMAVALTTKGGIGIMLATVSFDMGIINKTVFDVFVMTAILTTIIGGYWFRIAVSKGWVNIKDD